MPSRFRDVLDTVVLICAELVQLQQLCETQHCVQRGTQLVAHPR